MADTLLTIEGRPFSAAQVLAGGDSAELTPYQQQTLAFCQRWLQGVERFTLHTSGSTGQPKPIELTRAQMTLSATLTGQALGLRSGDRALVCLNTAYIAGVMMLVRGLVLGLEMTVIAPTRRPLAAFSAETTFDFTAVVPLQVQSSLQSAHDTALLNRFKGILIGGAPITPALLADIRARITAPTFHTYGMTETVSHIALKRLNGADADDYFVPFPGVALDVDARGCLTIESALSRGRTLVTNDVVALETDGRFRWLGRADNVINSGGVKVQAEKVERALASLPPLADRRLFVVGLPDPTLGQVVAAFVEGEPVADLDALLASLVGAPLLRYELPKQVHFLPHFAETPTGKIDRRATRQLIGR